MNGVILQRCFGRILKRFDVLFLVTRYLKITIVRYVDGSSSGQRKTETKSFGVNVSSEKREGNFTFFLSNRTLRMVVGLIPKAGSDEYHGQVNRC